MKTILYIISLCALYIFLSVQIDVLAQSPAATRAYCDNNRNIAVQMTTQNLSTNLPIIVSQEVAKVSQSFVTNAYPVPVPVTNTVYVDTVISNQIIYQTTQTEVYATYAFTTNTYIMNFITNIVTVTNTYSIGMSNILQTADNEGAFLFVGDVEERNTGASNVFEAIHHQASQSSGYGLRIGSFHEGLQQKSEYNGDYGISYTNIMGNYLYSLYSFVSPFFNSVYVGDDIYNRYVDDTVPASVFKGSTATNRVIAISNAKTIMGGSLYIRGQTLYNFMVDADDDKIASVRDTIILSTAPEETRENGFKSYVGHNGNIIIDTAPVVSDSYYSQSNMCCSFASQYDVMQNIKGSIILRTQKGLNDIYIDEVGSYDIRQLRKSFAQVIGQMITNVVNEMRPQ